MISGVPTCFPQSNPKLPTDQKIYIVKTGNHDTEMILKKRAEQKADTKTHENQGLRPVLSNLVSADHTQGAEGDVLSPNPGTLRSVAIVTILNRKSFYSRNQKNDRLTRRDREHTTVKTGDSAFCTVDFSGFLR